MVAKTAPKVVKAHCDVSPENSEDEEISEKKQPTKKPTILEKTNAKTDIEQASGKKGNRYYYRSKAVGKTRKSTDQILIRGRTNKSGTAQVGAISTAH